MGGIKRAGPGDFVYYWRVRARLPERFGQRCAVLARGALNSAMVEFEDGYRVITSRNYVRRVDKRDKGLAHTHPTLKGGKKGVRDE
jgi:hypothetical protein